MLYATAMVTGFRASELASLLPSNFDLDGTLPTATVKASNTKNRKEAVQPLPPDVAEALHGYLDGRPADLPVWPGTWPVAAAEMLRIDLEAAGIPYRDESDRVADFHALRHSYITLLSRSGVSPKLAQELARHSDIRLTMNVYTHTGLFDLAGAVDSLPTLLPTRTGKEAATLAATGTDGRGGPRADQKPMRFGDTGRHSLTTPDNADKQGSKKAGCHKTAENTAELTLFDSGCERMITPEKETTRPGFEPGQREPKYVVHSSQTHTAYG